MPRFVILLICLLSDLLCLLVTSTMQADIGVIGLAVMVVLIVPNCYIKSGVGPEFDIKLC